MICATDHYTRHGRFKPPSFEGLWDSSVSERTYEYEEAGEVGTTHMLLLRPDPPGRCVNPGADGASATAGAAVAALRSRTAARRSQPLTTVWVEGRCRPNPDPAPRRPSPRPGRSSPVSLIVTAGIAISGGRPG